MAATPSMDIPGLAQSSPTLGHTGFISYDATATPRTLVSVYSHHCLLHY